MSAAPSLTLAVRLGRRAASALVGASLEVASVASESDCDDVEGVARVLTRASERARTSGARLRGVAFAVPADPHWRALATEAASRLGLPSTCVGSADAALDAAARRDGPDLDSAALLDTDDLRLALRLNGRRYAGVRGRAGDVAHLGLDRTGVLTCTCGRNGCLAVLLDAGEHTPAPPLPRGIAPAPSRSLAWLAVAGVALVNTLNPGRLIVQGAPFEAVPALDWFSTVVRRGCLEATGAGLHAIVRARPDGTLAGAAAHFDRLGPDRTPATPRR